jgi:hypothetical protein
MRDIGRVLNSLNYIITSEKPEIDDYPNADFVHPFRNVCDVCTGKIAECFGSVVFRTDCVIMATSKNPLVPPPKK